MVKIFKKEFEKKLIELGYIFRRNPAGYYILRQNNNADLNIIAQLICSEPTDEFIHGSHNGNVIQSIGYFKLRLPKEVKSPDYIILAFQNSISNSAEFIIIPYAEFKRRLIKRNRISINNRKFELLFWLMPDGCLYDTTNINTEGEWYYLSKGVNGRMADETDWDYTGFLNEWGRLMISV